MGPRIVFFAAMIVVAAAVSAAVKAMPSEPLKAVLMGAGGPLLLAAAPLYAVVRLRFRSRAARTTGTVERCEEGGPGEAACELTIAFTDLAGDRRVFTEDRAPRRAEGDQVPVRYDPADPSDAELDRHPVVDVLTVAAMLAIGGVLSYAAWSPHVGE